MALNDDLNTAGTTSDRVQGKLNSINDIIVQALSLGKVSAAITALIALGAFGCGSLNAQLGGGAPGLQLNGNGSTYGIPDATFKRLEQALDNPTQVFSQANYQQLWTLSPEEAKKSGRLPQGLTAAPSPVRVWEPWFRKELTVKGQPLSTGQIYKLKAAIVGAAVTDPNFRFVPGRSQKEVFGSFDSVTQKGLNSVGISYNDLSPNLKCMLAADVTRVWVGQKRYSATKDNYLLSIEKTDRYPNWTELTNQDYGLDCGTSNLLFVHSLRAYASQRSLPLQVGAALVSRLAISDPRPELKDNFDGHVISGVMLKTSGGKRANLYYDPTAGSVRPGTVNLAGMLAWMGPIDAVSIEKIISLHGVIETSTKFKLYNGSDDMTYNFINGETWPQLGVGNFDPIASGPRGGDGRFSQMAGWKAYWNYAVENRQSIKNLEDTINRIASGR